ncbi:MAG: ATPase, T2SS/T4P/T4SS family [Kiritimatiellia bacterium]
MDRERADGTGSGDALQYCKVNTNSNSSEISQAVRKARANEVSEMADTIRLEIRRPDREPATFDIEPGVYTIGRDSDCKIRLSHSDVEPRHAILTVRQESCWIEDLFAQTGTFVEGQRVHGRQEVHSGQAVTIGPFTIVVRFPSPLQSPPAAPAAVPPEQPRLTPPSAASEPLQPPGISPVNADADVRRSIKLQIHREFVERLDLKRLATARINKEDLERRALTTIQSIVQEVAPRLPPGIRPEDLVKEIYQEAVGLGPLEDFLADPEITEIMVNGHSHVYIERFGKLIRTDCAFMDDDSVLAIIERIVAPLGRRIDESQPYVDARLPDGSRVNAIIPPLSLVGPCLTIRKFSKTPFTADDLIRLGTMTRDIAEFARICVLLRKNIVVSGGTGSGKTTLLNVLSSYLPADERIVTIEDAAELRLEQSHVVRLEARPPNIEGKGAVTIRDLVRNALRMRPDRIVVGECRGGEALDMLQAMNTGHDGSLTTVHANSPRDVISRLETMVLMSGMDLPVRAIREQIASAINLVIHLARLSDGSRKIVKISEIVGLEGDQITMQDIFVFEQTGVTPQGKVLGVFKATGAVPTFIEQIAAHGLTIDREMFNPAKTLERNLQRIQ